MTVELVLLPRVSYRGQEISAPRLRGLLALLAGERRGTLSSAGLARGLWPHEQPENPTKALQILVSRARAQLGPDVIASTPNGYRLSLRDDQIDSSAVLIMASACAEHTRGGDHPAALSVAQAALALWEGVVPAGHEAGDPLSELRAARASTHGMLVRARALALSRLGRRAEAVEALADLARERPRDDEVLLELLRCEAATVGVAAALARYEAYRRALREELGTDPGPALTTLHRQLLEGDAPAIRHGVRHEPNELLGRAGDAAAVADLLRISRVTSIVGAGGLGKTRLAHVVSRAAEQRVVHFVGLAGVAEDGDVAGEVASVLGAGEPRRSLIRGVGAPTDVVTGIVTAIGPAPALLVLDNCEHVVRRAAELVQALVSMTPDLRVLTTSRAPLGLSSESVYLLPQLDLLTAIELFGQRAKAARAGVELPGDVVEELCRHLDGLPLAVELAAAKVRVMSVAEIARHVDDRFALLRGGARDAPERHRTLHAVVDWSWNLLDPAAQAAMRALSVFPGGFTVDAAGHLLAGGDVVEILEHLVDQSLLTVTETSSDTRFTMLETVREFSTAARDAAGETSEVGDRFLAWARDFGLAHHASVFAAHPLPSVLRVQGEQDNLVQAMRLALTCSDSATVAAVCAVLGSMWSVESNYVRLAALIEDTASLLSHFRPEPDLVEATRTASTLCTLYLFLVQDRRAVRSLVTMRRLPAAPPDTLIRAMAIVLGLSPADLGADGSALRTLGDSDEPLLAGIANGAASYLMEGRGDLDGALTASRRMLAAFERRAMPWMRIIPNARIGELCLLLERGEDARHHFRAALSVLEDLGAWPDSVGIRLGMVLANLQIGDLEDAEQWLELAALHQTTDTEGAPGFDIAVRAEIALARGEVDLGLFLWRRAAETLANATRPVPVTSPEMDPWTLEVRAVTVIAHAHHDRLVLVEQMIEEIAYALTMIPDDPAASLASFPVCGALLLAYAMVDLDRARRSGTDLAAGARLIALAERFGFRRNFQPTMSAARARSVAEHAAGPTYADAVSSYAGLDRAGLLAAAREAARPDLPIS